MVSLSKWFIMVAGPGGISDQGDLDRTDGPGRIGGGLGGVSNGPGG